MWGHNNVSCVRFPGIGVKGPVAIWSKSVFGTTATTSPAAASTAYTSTSTSTTGSYRVRYSSNEERYYTVPDSNARISRMR